MIVGDASVVVDLLLGAGSGAGDALTARLNAGEVVCAPHLLDVEVAQTLRRFVHRRDLDPHEAGSMLGDFLDLPIRRYPHGVLLARAFELRDGVTVYDGVYLALAEALQVPLLTGDAALGSVPGCRAVVDVVATAR